MAYIIDTWYVEYLDGTIGPCQNRKTAEYLVSVGEAIRLVDITRELMSK